MRPRQQRQQPMQLLQERQDHGLPDPGPLGPDLLGPGPGPPDKSDPGRQGPELRYQERRDPELPNPVPVLQEREPHNPDLELRGPELRGARGPRGRLQEEGPGLQDPDLQAPGW